MTKLSQHFQFLFFFLSCFPSLFPFFHPLFILVFVFLIISNIFHMFSPFSFFLFFIPFPHFSFFSWSSLFHHVSTISCFCHNFQFLSIFFTLFHFFSLITFSSFLTFFTLFPQFSPFNIFFTFQPCNKMQPSKCSPFLHFSSFFTFLNLSLSSTFRSPFFHLFPFSNCPCLTFFNLFQSVFFVSFFHVFFSYVFNFSHCFNFSCFPGPGVSSSAIGNSLRLNSARRMIITRCHDVFSGSFTDTCEHTVSSVNAMLRISSMMTTVLPTWEASAIIHWWDEMLISVNVDVGRWFAKSLLVQAHQ